MVDRVDLDIEGLSDFETIGAGGFSTVYSAWDDGFSRRVAVKLLHHLDERGRRRFEREGSLLGLLSGHANVITPFRSGTTARDVPYLVMEYVDGGSLDDLLGRRGPLPWTEAIDLVAPIADALQHGHQHGVLHRDVKPANILLSSSGVPKLADYGIASLREATATHEAYTLAHSPPETFVDGFDRRNERSDLYSLASTLFTLITGHPPYAVEGVDSSSALMRRIERHPLPELGVGPPELSGLLTRGLAKSPDDRPATATEFREELRAVRSLAGPNDLRDSTPTASFVPHPPGQIGAATTELATSGPTLDGRRRRTRVGLVGFAAVTVLGVVAWQAISRSTDDSVAAAPDGTVATAGEDDDAESSAASSGEDSTTSTGSSPDDPPVSEAGPARGTYEFEADAQGWGPSSSSDDCPDAAVSVLEGAGRDGSSALAWELPSPFQTRCVIEVNIVMSPPNDGVLEQLDRTAAEVGCYVNVPPEFRDGSLGFSDLQYLGMWARDDGSQHEHVGPEVAPTPEDADWIELAMRPGQEDYRTIALNPAPRHPDFGAVETFQIWVRSNSSVEVSGPILLDDCWVASVD